MSAVGLAIERAGSGPAVVLVHGLGGTANVWEPQVRALSERFTLVRFDLEGAGRSPAVSALSVERWVGNVEAVLASQGIDRATFVGHSLGTLVLQHFAARHPGRVEKLALLGVNRAPADDRRQTVRDRAAKVRNEGMLGIADGVIKAALSEHTQKEKLEVVACVREMLLRQDPEGYARCCEAVAEAVGAPLGEIRCPVLFISGSDDTVSTPAVAQKMVPELKQATVIVLEKCGHWMTLERPSEVNTALLEFLAA